MTEKTEKKKGISGTIKEHALMFHLNRGMEVLSPHIGAPGEDMEKAIDLYVKGLYDEALMLERNVATADMWDWIEGQCVRYGGSDRNTDLYAMMLYTSAMKDGVLRDRVRSSLRLAVKAAYRGGALRHDLLPPRPGPEGSV